MRTIIFYVHIVFSLIGTLPSLFKLKQLKKTVSDKECMTFSQNIAKRFAISQIRYSGATFNIVGQENIPKDEAVLFVSNHQSNFDLALFLGYIDKYKGYISKTELLKIPILRTWMKEIGCVFMDRSDIRNAAKSVIEGVNFLKNGHSLVIFPEGTRSKSSNIGDFKGGSFKFATKSKVPIIPVTINGTYKIMEANNNRIKPANVDVFIHPPIYTDSLTAKETTELPERIKAIIQSKLI